MINSMLMTREQVWDAAQQMGFDVKDITPYWKAATVDGSTFPAADRPVKQLTGNPFIYLLDIYISAFDVVGGARTCRGVFRQPTTDFTNGNPWYWNFQSDELDRELIKPATWLQDMDIATGSISRTSYFIQGWRVRVKVGLTGDGG